MRHVCCARPLREGRFMTVCRRRKNEVLPATLRNAFGRESDVHLTSGLKQEENNRIDFGVEG